MLVCRIAQIQPDKRHDAHAGRLCVTMGGFLFLAASMAVGAAGAQRLEDPLRFFEGRTEGMSTVKIFARKSYRSKSAGRGEIASDGTLHLVQRVEEDGKPAFERRWQMRKIGPGRFTGTMSEAKGPVTVDEIEGRFRFRFKVKGGFLVEQWLTPLANGTSARSEVTVRKLGLTVGSSEGFVRKIE